MRRKLICVDFDGVLHSYTSGWKGADVISDPPVPGAMEWLVEMTHSDELDIHIYSSRSGQIGGIAAMQAYLIRHISEDVEWARLVVLNIIKWPTEKPPAHLSIDDRGFCFVGKFPSKEEMLSFKPWNK